MKKIILTLFIFLLFINKLFALWLPIWTEELIFWKIGTIKKINNSTEWLVFEFNIKNYVNYKIKDDILDIFEYRNELLQKEYYIYENSFYNWFKVKPWDIIIVSRYSWWDGILKIWCEKNKMYIEWIKNQMFITWPNATIFRSGFENWENRIYIDAVDKNNYWIKLFILDKFNKKVWWCEWLKKFFDKDRTLEDLDWKNLEKYVYFWIWFLVLIILVIFFVLFKIYKKINLWKK
jgi:hypothetical protein